VLPTDPPEIEAYAAKLCAAQPDLTTRLGCRLVAAELGTQENAASRLRVESEDGRAELRADLLVDASGDGELGALGAAETSVNNFGTVAFRSLLSGDPATNEAIILDGEKMVQRGDRALMLQIR